MRGTLHLTVVPVGRAGNLLVDGVFSGRWKLDPSPDSIRVEVGLLRRISESELEAVGEEALRLFRFAHPVSGPGDVVFRRLW